MGMAAWAGWRSGRRAMLGIGAGLLLTAIAIGTAGSALAIERADLIAAAALFAALLPWLVHAEHQGKVAIPQILRFFGDASYSIYLAHGPALLLVLKVSNGLGWSALFPLIALLGIAAGIAYHFLIERPLLALMPKRR